MILDVGSGTGALEADFGEIIPDFSGSITGLDISLENLVYAKSTDAQASWVQGDALHLPFPSGQFDMAFCHFLLLWVQDPLHALVEMRRVTRPDGFVLALAEPDYGGRLDFPPELEILGSWQRASLRRQGANPIIGRRLGWLLRNAGLVEVETGVLGAQWQDIPSRDEIESEWSCCTTTWSCYSDQVMTPLAELISINSSDWMKQAGARVSVCCMCRRFMRSENSQGFMESGLCCTTTWSCYSDQVMRHTGKVISINSSDWMKQAGARESASCLFQRFMRSAKNLAKVVPIPPFERGKILN